MASKYVLASSEYGEVSLKQEIEKTFIFHVRKNDNKFIYFIVNPTEELLDLFGGLQLGGRFNCRHFFSDLSPSDIKGKMFSGINPYDVISIPYTIKKLLLEREWEFDDDSYSHIKLSFTYKGHLAQFNYGYTHKKMRIQFKNSYLVIPHFAASMTPIDRTTSKYYKRFELLELTKEYAVVLLIYEKNRSILTDASLDIEGTFTWHISGPTLLPPPPILHSEPVVDDLLFY